MAARAALELADSLVYTATGRHLNDLQRTILQQAWQGRKYLDIARRAGYTEGHVKDVAAQLWRLLSRVTGEKVTKQTLKSALERRLPGWRPQESAASQAATREGPITPSSPGEDSQAEGWQPPPGPASAAAQKAEAVWNLPLKPLLVGRQAAIARLDQLFGQGHRAIVIQGEGGLGKTTLAQHYFQHYLRQPSADVVLELMMAQHAADITPVEWVVEEWLRQDFGVEPGREFGVTLDRLRRQLRQCRVLVLVDNLEPALDHQGRFLPQHRRYRDLLRGLTDTASPTRTLITSRDRLCEPGLPVTHYRLPGLDSSAWATYFQERGVGVEPAILQAMHRAYGGNAKAMEILWGAIQADFEADMASYWQIHQNDLLGPVDLQNLLESQIQRLRQLDPQAYELFCRLGVFRFQDVPTVPLAGLQRLMADSPQPERSGAITSLQNRSLLDGCRGQYWLHPGVRQGAIAHLNALPQAAQEIAQAHYRAARFWSDSVVRITTRQDALQAWEAYYHYVAVADYGAAAQVILRSRDNQWGQYLPLGSTLYRMGLIQPVTEAITAILPHIPRTNSDAGELFNILGDLYWIAGRIPAAIHCQEEAINIAQACLQSVGTEAAAAHRHYYLTMLVVDSRLSQGLYHLDLGHLETAAALFRQVIGQATGSRHQRWADKATVCLALVLSTQGPEPEALALADRIYPQILTTEQTHRQAFFVQLLGHAYLNLGHWPRAQRLLTAALAAAEAGDYLQIKANALSGLGRYARSVGQPEQALAYHYQAIDLLDQVGATCDLAAAYLQLGLTLQAETATRAAAAVPLEKALQLFAALPAPRQVEVVQKAWESGPARGEFSSAAPPD